MGAAEIHVTAVAIVRGKAQRGGGEVPDVERSAQPRCETRRGLGRREDRLHGTRPGHQREMAGDRLRVVCDVRASGKREDSGRYEPWSDEIKGATDANPHLSQAHSEFRRIGY